LLFNSINQNPPIQGGFASLVTFIGYLIEKREAVLLWAPPPFYHVLLALSFTGVNWGPEGSFFSLFQLTALADLLERFGQHK
jgi:hypothetical protein